MKRYQMKNGGISFQVDFHPFDLVTMNVRSADEVHIPQTSTMVVPYPVRNIKSLKWDYSIVIIFGFD